MENTLKALANAARQKLLDALRQKDGQGPEPKTLSDLKTKLEQDSIGSHTMEFPTELGILTCLMTLTATL
ncbi:hypothetical protein [Octadecabacter antarcticus]|uniref:hypothetical protein n=1 Tax=Octadecabacter antarcticus TaxID=1217908 RepID=UPI000180694D|nr:hypothetical protein [Octadecabacter antarcticus]